MIRRQSHTVALRASVSMEMIPTDEIFLPLHIYQELGPSTKHCADISFHSQNNMLRQYYCVPHLTVIKKQNETHTKP